MIDISQKVILNFSGRILNRFSKDLGSMDEQLPPAFSDAITVSCFRLIFIFNILSFSTLDIAQYRGNTGGHFPGPTLGCASNHRPRRDLHLPAEVLHGELQEDQEAGGDQ